MITTTLSKPTPQEFEGVITDAIEQKSAKGIDQLRLSVLTETLPQPTNISDLITMSEAAEWKLREFLRAMGYPDQDGAAITIDPHDLIGRPCRVLVTREPASNGKSYLVIKKWLREQNTATSNA